MTGVQGLPRAIGGSVVGTIKCRRERRHGARLLIQIRNQTIAVPGASDFSELPAIDAVDFGARKTTDFDSPTGKERISPAVSKTDTVPGPEPLGRRSFFRQGSSNRSDGLRIHILPIVGVGKHSDPGDALY